MKPENGDEQMKTCQHKINEDEVRMCKGKPIVTSLMQFGVVDFGIIISNSLMTAHIKSHSAMRAQKQGQGTQDYR